MVADLTRKSPPSTLLNLVASTRWTDRLTDARNGHISRTLHVKAIDIAVVSNFASLIKGGDENGNLFL
jgi:hypothetical protein